MIIGNFQIENPRTGVREEFVIPISWKDESGRLAGWSIGAQASGADIQIDEALNCEFLAIYLFSYHVALIGRAKSDQDRHIPQISILSEEEGVKRWHVADPFAGQRSERRGEYGYAKNEAARLMRAIEKGAKNENTERIVYHGKYHTLDSLQSALAKLLRRLEIAQAQAALPLHEVHVIFDDRPLRIGDHVIEIQITGR
jgi:hypothetical protein